MAEPKTKPTDASVPAFLNTIVDDQVRKDCKAIAKMFEAATKSKPKMWGTAIVGFGLKQVAYANGRTADWPLTGFSPRKRNIVLYINGGLAKHATLLETLGAHECGGGCLYLKRLSDVHVPTLKALLKTSIKV